jgi:protein gp37
MSLGHGRIERAILSSLLPVGRTRSTRSLATAIYSVRSTTVTEAQLASLRRALGSLRAAGKIDRDPTHQRWQRTGEPDDDERQAMRRAAVRETARRAAARKPPSLDEFVSLQQWHTLDEPTKAALLQPDLGDRTAPSFTKQTGTDIEWAMWSSNPITGCEHTCSYCYARELATSARLAVQYPFGFAPTLHPKRLISARFMKVPPAAATDTRHRNVFVGSMTDMFGRWVPEEWIEAVLRSCREAPQWNFLCLTKFPKRMAEFDIPPNAWMGTSVDLQARVKAAEAAFANVASKVRWLSCEPLIEPLRFKHLDRFHWIVIGGASATASTPDWRPPFEWVADLVRQARDAGLKVYFKTNLLRSRILELPFDAPIKADPLEAPAVFHYLGRAA